MERCPNCKKMRVQGIMAEIQEKTALSNEDIEIGMMPICEKLTPRVKEISESFKQVEELYMKNKKRRG